MRFYTSHVYYKDVDGTQVRVIDRTYFGNSQCTNDRLGGNDTYSAKVNKGFFDLGWYCYNTTNFTVFGRYDSND
jgi:hypothetical protein